MLRPALQILAIFVLFTLTNAQERRDVTLGVDVLPYTVTGEPMETAANGLSTMFFELQEVNTLRLPNSTVVFTVPGPGHTKAFQSTDGTLSFPVSTSSSSHSATLTLSTSTVIFLSTETSISLPTSSSSAATISHNQKISIIAGSTVGALVVIAGLVLVFLFRHKYFNRRRRKAEDTNITSLAVYDLKYAVPTNEELESSSGKLVRSPSEQVLLEHVPPAERDTQNTIDRTSESSLTQRQMMLQERAGSIREEIATYIAGASEDTHRIIQELTERVRSLEESLNSDWAHGLTDTPPPVYSEIF